MKLESAAIFTGIYLIHTTSFNWQVPVIEPRPSYTSQSVIECQGCF